MAGLRAPLPVDFAVAAIAERQEGVISVAQLRACGLGRGAIEHRVRAGRLHRVHRGVYAVGHRALSWKGRLWAATLAVGEGSAISHRTAGYEHAIGVGGSRIELVSRTHRRSPEGLLVHHSRNLQPHDVMALAGLPVTTPMRTLLDLEHVLTPHRLERAVHRAEHLRLLDVRPLRGRAGPKLRAALATLTLAEPEITRSELEELLLELCAVAGLPRPVVNQKLLGFEVDFLWPARGLVVEVDGRETHLNPTAFEEDRRRDALLQSHGFRVVRFTYRQVTRRPDEVVEILRALFSP